MIKILAGFIGAGGVIAYAAVIALWVAMLIGWVMNIVKIFGDSFVIESAMGVLRIVGIVLAPIGGVVGWL